MIREQSNSRYERLISYLICIAFLATIAMPFVSMTVEAGAPSVTYTGNFSSAGGLAITPEGNWLTDPISVTGGVTIARVDVSLGITHASPADLQIWLASPAGAWVNIPWAPWGGARQTFQLNNFNGQGSAGVWQLWMLDGVVNGITGKEDYCTLGIVYSLGSNMITPAAGATLSGNYAVSTTATSATSCRLFVDDQRVADCIYNAVTTRWEFTLTTTAFPDGAHTVTVTARDYAGNEVADGHAVTFDNWNIYANFGNPPAASVIFGNYAVTCGVPDYAVQGELYVDGSLAGVDNTVAGGIYSITLDTTMFPDGIHNLVWLVYDPDGHSSAAARGTTINNYAISCSIASPGSGSVQSGAITVAANVPAYATRGDLYFDGTFIAQDTTIAAGQFTFPLDTRNYPDGVHILTVQAYDPDQNSAVGASSVTFNNYNIVASIVSPGTGVPISGSPTVWASTSSYAVRGELLVDGSLYAVTTTLTNIGGVFYQTYTLNTKDFGDGSHRLTAVSYDQWGDSAAQTQNYNFDNYQIYVTITAPGAGTTVSGTMQVNASVPAYAVRGELFIDDSLVDVDTTIAAGQFQFSINTTSYRDGNRNLRVVAYDPDGATAVMARTANFDNWAISVAITSPTGGATVSGTATITANVPAYAARGELYVDGALVDTTTTISSGSYSFSLNTKNVHDGTHSMTVVAYDPDGTSAAGTIGVTVDNYKISCTLWWPTTGATISGTSTCWIYAPDYSVRGELYVDGALAGFATVLQFVGGGFGYFQVDLVTSSFSDGPHAFSARAYDPDGNYAGATTRPVIDNYQVYAAIASPTEGQTVSASVTVRVNVPPYATKCELYVDGMLANSSTTQSGGQFAPAFNTLSFTDGKHTVTVKVFDPDGNTASDARGIMIDNYNIVVAFVQPLNGFSISSSYTVIAGVPAYSVRGELYVDDALQAVTTTLGALNRYSFSLDTTRYPDGNHRIRVSAFDPDGNEGAATVNGAFDNWQMTAAFVTPPVGGSISATATANVSVPWYSVKGELFVDGTLVATDTTISAGLYSFSFDTRAFPDGYHALGVTAYDPDGNAASDTRAVVIDNYQITCTFVAPASGATISGRSYLARATVPAYAVRGELFVDGASVGTTTTQTSGEFRFTLDTTAFHDGLHGFQVTAYDPDGKPGTASVTATIDNYNISVSMILVPGGSSLTGTQTVYGVVPAYATKGELYVNDALFGVNTTKNTFGWFQLSLDTTRFPDGAYRLKWLVYDPDGNSAVATANVNFNNYRLPVNFVNLPASLSGTAASVSVSVPSYAVRGELYIDGTLVSTTSTRSGGNYVFSVDTTAFRDGAHSISVKVFDPYANYAVAARSVTIDNYNIVVTMVAPAVNGVMTGTYTVRATVPDYSAKGELYIDGNLWATTKTRTLGEYRFSLDTKTLREGTYSVMVVAYDPDGNSGSASVTASVDNYQLSVTLTLSPGGSRIFGTQTMYGYVPVYSTKGEFYIDGALVGTDSVTTYNGVQYYFDFQQDTTKLKDGFHTFRVIAYDPDGNAAVAQTTVEVDNWQIFATINTPAASSMRSGSVWVNASVPAYARKGELYIDGSFFALTTTISSGQYRFSFDSRTVADGWHSIGVRAYDPDGESGYSAVSVLLDNTAPNLWNVTVIYPSGQSAVKKGDYVSISVQSSDASGGSGLTSVWLNATNLGDGTSEMLDDGLHNDSSSLDTVFGSGGVRVDATMGLHFAFLSATDRAGNTATASAKVAFDTHDPIITSSYCVYPPGQTAAKFGDQVRIVSRVIDTKMTVDTVLVIDTSGSMSGNPIRDARDAAKIFVGLMSENDRAAVYSFHGGNNDQPKQEIAFTSDKSALNSTIDGLSASDWTPLYDAVWTAIQYAKTSSNLPVVIVLTDGNDVIANNGHSTHTLEQCKYASIPVYAIGLIPGGGFDPLNETVLKEMAQTSDGGSYYKAPDSSQLKQIYEDLARVVEKMDVGGIVKVYCDASPIGGPSYVTMYDDGGHDDLGVLDGYFGTDRITVGSASTAVISVTTTALDVAGNPDTDTAPVRVDNTLPALANLVAKYRAGQWWAADGDSVYFVAQVTDSGAVSGMNYVELDASDVGGPSSVRMVDDGTGNDAISRDGNWTSPGVVVATGSNTRFFIFRVTGWDNASNAAAQAGNVYIDNGRPLSMNITSPAQGQYVEGLLTMRVQATDIPAILDVNLTLLPPGTVYQTSYNGLTGYFEHSLDTVQLEDGTYFLTATGRDIARRAIPGPSMVTFYVDNHAPVLRLNAPKNNDYVSGMVTVDTAGTMDTFLLSADYNIDGLGWVTASTVWDTTKLSDGKHTLEARAADKAGHVTSTLITVTVDNTNPTCRIVAPADRGILAGRYTLTVKASDSVGISRVDLTGGLSVEAEYNPQSGYYEYSLDTRTLDDGNYTLGATARDDSGKITAATGISFRVDNHVPTLNILSPSAYDYVFGTVIVQLVSSDGPYTDELLVEYKVDERSWVALQQSGAIWTAVWNTSAFSDGSHTLYLRSVDIIGNVAAQTIQLTVDNHAPLCQVYSPLVGQYIEAKQLFQVLATDEVGVVNLTLQIPGVGNFLMSYNGYTGYYEYSLLTTGYPDGDYNATIRAVDRSGKVTAVGPMPFHIDNIPPSFVLVKPREGDPISDNISVEVRWTSGRASSEEAKVTYRIDTGAWIPAEQNTSVASLSDGSHLVTVRAVDPAGHTTDVSVRIFIDKNWPEMTVLTPKSGVHIRSAVDMRIKARDEAGMRSLSIARGNNTPEEVYLNGATGFYEYSLDLSGLPDASYNLTVTAYDLSGHPTVSNLTVVWDTTGPQVSLAAPALGGDKKGQVKFSIAVTDPSGVSKVSIRLRTGDWRDMRLASNGNYVYTWDTSVADDGQRTVETRATDKLGNEAFETYDVSVKNYQANFFVEYFNLWLLLVLIIGFGVVTYAVLRRPRYPVQYIEAVKPAVSPSKVADTALPVPPARPEPAAPLHVPVPVPAPAKEESFFVEDQAVFELDKAPASRPAVTAAAPPAKPSGTGFSLWGNKTEKAQPKGATGASIAAAIGTASSAPAPSLRSVPPPEQTGFEEVTDGGEIEEVKMEPAWMPSGSLPAASEMPRAVISARPPVPAPAPASSGDLWEEESNEEFFEEDKAPAQRPSAPPARPAAPAQSYAPPPSKGISPLEQQMLSMGLTTKVTRTEEERKRRGPPAGWSHPRPAELPPEAPAPAPQAPPRPRAAEGVMAPQSALKPVPPSAQKLSPKDREKMGVMLDDLLSKSRKR